MKKILKVLLPLMIMVSILTGCSLLERANPSRPGEPSPTEQANATDQNNRMDILFVNVGKADSTLVSFGDNHYLIDTGLVESLPALVQALRLMNVEKLNGIFLTHTDSDHVGGLDGLLQLFPVDQVYAAEITTNKKNGSNVVDEKAQSAGKTVKRLVAGDEIILDQSQPQFKFQVIGPIVFNADDDNDNSLVMVLDASPVTCLLTGDMQFAQEMTLLGSNAIKPCTILKVGNHGNPDASSNEFIMAASPEFAVFSTDSFVEHDTPAPRVLSALQTENASVFVTQEAKTGILAKISGKQVVMERLSMDSPAPMKGITIDALDRKAEFITIKNDSSAAVDMSNWWIHSGRGNEMFFFPKGQQLSPNATLTVASGKNPPNGDLTWNEKNVWHDSKDDVAVLYDAMGNAVARYELR